MYMLILMYFSLMATEYCRDDMDDLDLNILVNNETRDDADSLSFDNIGIEYNAESVYDTVSDTSNSIDVRFGASVHLKVFKIFSSGGEDLPEDLIILLTGYENEEKHQVLIHLDDDEFVVDDTFPTVERVVITFVSSSSPTFQLRPEFLGCVKPGMSISTLTGLLKSIIQACEFSAVGLKNGQDTTKRNTTKTAIKC